MRGLRKDLHLGAVVEETNEFRVKVATQNEIEAFVGSEFKPDPAFCYLHVIAMGAGEYYGCNSNGDFFPVGELKVRHRTFETDAKIFKEHKNKPEFGHPSFGYVVKSWYNPTMHRVELILAIDRKKSPDIIARIDRGDQLEVSMGCRVIYDICSICGNKARKKDEYCDHIKRELRRIYPDGRQVCMINVQPTFFDISVVGKRADKLAFALKKIAGEGCDLSHVHDVGDEDDDEKQASIDKEVQAEAVTKALNDGFLANVLPKMEAIEPDLPAGLLDRIALRHNLPDILYTFLRNAIPLKPTEFTRIIVIQNGLPVGAHQEVLDGVLAAKPGKHDPFANANYQPEISNLVGPYLKYRSAFMPHVLDRAHAAIHPEKAASYMPSYLDSNYSSGTFDAPLHYYPLENSPQHRVVVERQRPYATVPVMYDAEEYARRQQAACQRRPLRDPINPLAVGVMLGTLYAAYRGADGVAALAKALSSQGAAIGAGALAFAVLDALKPKVNQAMQKHASWSNVWYKGVVPFVGLHMMAAHYRDQYARGAELNGIQQMVAEYPDMLSLAAPFALHHMHKALKASPIKAASDDYVEKLADLADSLANAAITGVIFRGRGVSGAGGVVDQVGDALLMNQIFNVMEDGNPDKTRLKTN